MNNNTVKEFLEKCDNSGKNNSFDDIVEMFLTTDMLSKENALSIFDNEEWYGEDNYLKKFLEYKKRNGFYLGLDCDVSILCVVMYVLMNDDFRLTDIVCQNKCKRKKEIKCKQKYEIRACQNTFKGDTLTSAILSVKLYLGCLWKRIDGDEQLKKEKSEFYSLFNRVACTGIPIARFGTWNEYCFNNSKVIWEAMDEPVKEFLKSYFKFGNYMCVPGKSYKVSAKKWTSFNMARSHYGEWDTVDTLLWKVYLYFIKDDDKYLHSIFTEKKVELSIDSIEWFRVLGIEENMNGIEKWEHFINMNCLNDFVSEDRLIPLSMKTGEPIVLKEDEEYNAFPQDYQEFLQFFGQLARRINARSERIEIRLKESNQY